MGLYTKPQHFHSHLHSKNCSLASSIVRIRMLQYGKNMEIALLQALKPVAALKDDRISNTDRKQTVIPNSCEDGAYIIKQPGKSDVGASERKSKPGTLLGAIALITGTSIGVGILALPARTVATGFLPSTSIMGASWLFLVLEALLMIEVNLAVRQKEERSGSLSKVISLRTMAESTLGKPGGVMVAAVYVLITYALIVAYISKSGEVFSLLLHIPRSLAEALFTFTFGYFLLAGGTKLADQVNQIMTTGLLGLFMLLVVGGSSYGEWAGLLHQDWTMAPESLPVIFLALVYHDLIPIICAYLDGDVARIRASVVIGSGVPLAMLICWNVVALSLAPASDNADPIGFLMRNGGAGHAFIVQFFSLLAVFTSTIGSVLGMSEFFIEQLGGQSSNTLATNYKAFKFATRPKLIRIASFILVLVPPLVISLNITDAFITAADIAGGYGMTTLYGVLPPVMAWGLIKNRSQKSSGFLASNPSMQTTLSGERSWITRPGTLAVTSLCACGIIVGQLFLDFS